VLAEAAYAHHEPGDWRPDHARAVLAGKLEIQINGEASIRADALPANAYATLADIAEQCGYMVGRPCGYADGVTMLVSTREGEYRLEWSAVEVVGRDVVAGPLARIVDVSRGPGGRVVWSRHEAEALAEIQ
jgi:hypothetical protein